MCLITAQGDVDSYTGHLIMHEVKEREEPAFAYSFPLRLLLVVNVGVCEIGRMDLGNPGQG